MFAPGHKTVATIALEHVVRLIRLLTLRCQTKRKRQRHNSESLDVVSEPATNSESVTLRPRKQSARTVSPGIACDSVISLASKSTSTMDRTNISVDDAIAFLGRKLADPGTNSEYHAKRRDLLAAETSQRWDERARARASTAELKVQDIVCRIRESERIDPELFGNLPSEAVPLPQARDMGGRFLVNQNRIDRSRVFKIAQKLPKGSHLHLHFNSELPPETLFPHARSREMERTMFVRTTRPLTNREDFRQAEVVFNVLPAGTNRADCFASAYNPDWKDKNNSPWMLWSDFRKRFPLRPYRPAAGEYIAPSLDDAECWAREKMMITLNIAYSDRQTHNGAWACFNQGTRAFKGLLNYEGVYRWYIGHAIDSMMQDKVMYAELRPMLLDKTIPSNDGTRHLNHYDQMNIICEEVLKKHDELEKRGQLHKFPFGLKIIYCTPRSIPKQRMQTELNDCLKLKLQFPKLICGFDLVGAEDRPNNIGFYADLLVTFTETCKELGVSIPFMFHAGETLLDTGGSANPDNSNLYDSLLLNAKRIGHGYSLLKHPLLVEKYKQHNICLELCPISNELLHLCGNAREHPYPALLAAGLHCTLNADNPSLFR